MIPSVVQTRFDERTKEHAGARLFALVDGLQYAAATGRTLEAEGDYLLSLFAGTQDERLDYAGPWLWEIVVEQFGAHIAELEELRPASVVWLIAEHDAPTLAAKLRPRLNAKRPDGKDLLLRFWDPRVLYSLAVSVHETSRREFFGAALEWIFLYQGQRAYIRPYV